jgi:hypothetical protein
MLKPRRMGQRTWKGEGGGRRLKEAFLVHLSILFMTRLLVTYMPKWEARLLENLPTTQCEESRRQCHTQVEVLALNHDHTSIHPSYTVS